MFQLVRARPRLFVVIGLVLTLVLVSGTTVLATTWATSGAKVKKVKVVAADTAAFTLDSSYSDIPGLSLTMSVPKGKAIFLVTLAGSSSCEDGAGTGGTCWVRVLVNGQALNPQGDVLFIGPPNHGYLAGSHSMQFFTDPLPAGSYEFKAQWKTNAPVTFFNFYHRSLSVLRAKV